jgi:pentatricopeptide repeat protein
VLLSIPSLSFLCSNFFDLRCVSEDLYGAVLRALIDADRQEEAELLFQSMESGENNIIVKPSMSSHEAMLDGLIRGGDWKGAMELHYRMQEKGIPSSPQAVVGLLQAHAALGGKDAVVTAVRQLLKNNKIRFGEEPFRLISTTLLPDLEVESFDAFRQLVRRMGEENPKMRDSSLKLVRSLRVAQIESDRPTTAHKTASEIQAVQDKAWAQSTSHLLDFVSSH